MFRPLREGPVEITVFREGYPPGTHLSSISSPRISLETTQVLGLGLQAFSKVRLDTPVSVPIEIKLASSRPAVLGLSESSVLMPAGVTEAPFFIRGLALGTPVISASFANSTAVSQPVSVTTPNVLLRTQDSASTAKDPARFTASLGVSGGIFLGFQEQATIADRTIRITNATPALADLSNAEGQLGDEIPLLIRAGDSRAEFQLIATEAGKARILITGSTVDPPTEVEITKPGLLATEFDLGLGLQPWVGTVPLNTSDHQGIPLTIVSADPKVAMLSSDGENLTPSLQVEVRPREGYFNLQVHPTGLGETKLRITAPGLTTAELPVRVLKPSFHITSLYPESTVGQQLQLLIRTGVMAKGRFIDIPSAGNSAATFESSDPKVATLRWFEQTGNRVSGVLPAAWPIVEIQGPGTTTITASAEGYLPGTWEQKVIASPARRLDLVAQDTIPLGMSVRATVNEFGQARQEALIVSSGDPSILLVKGAFDRLPTPEAIIQRNFQADFEIFGLKEGEATLSLSSRGFPLAQMTIRVVKPTLELVGPKELRAYSWSNVHVQMSVTDRSGRKIDLRQEGTGPILTFQSGSPKVVELISQAERGAAVQARWSNELSSLVLNPLAVGESVLNVSSPLLAANSITSLPIKVLPASIQLTRDQPLRVGENLQEGFAFAVPGTLPAGFQFKYRSSDPSVVLVASRPQEKGLGELNLSLEKDAVGATTFIQGLKSGRASVTVSGEGFETSTLLVLVVPPKARLVVFPTTLQIPQSAQVQVRTGNEFVDSQAVSPVAGDLEFLVKVSDPSLAVLVNKRGEEAAQQPITVPSGQSMDRWDNGPNLTLKPLRPGTVTLSVSRAGFRESSVTIQIEGTPVPLDPQPAIGRAALERGVRFVNLGSHCAFRFPTARGHRYRIERSSNLRPDQWEALEPAKEGTGQVYDYIEPSKLGRQLFFRVTEIPGQ